MLAQHAAFLSDPRLQYRVLTPDTTAEIDGRVIAHVLDEISDRPHALIEGVDGIVYYVQHDPAIAEARANGRLRPNSFVQLRTASVGGRHVRTCDDLSDADDILANRAHFKGTLHRLLQRRVVQEQEQRWSGWLGRYHAALREEAKTSTDRLERLRRRHEETERAR